MADSSTTAPTVVLSDQLGGKELLELLHVDHGLSVAYVIQDKGIILVSDITQEVENVLVKVSA